VRDFGYGDLRDILAGVTEALGAAPVDLNRIGITGWSYGGFMTMWTITQTRLFRAAVAGAGIANWQSYYGENEIDKWMIPYFGASVYDDPAIYERSSPITYIKNVKTPTLILVGERDGECPLPQSYEFWHALDTLGVENQFVVYANEGHRVSNRNTAGTLSVARSRGSTAICNDGALASETAQQARRKREQAQAGGKDGDLRHIFSGIDLDQIQDAHFGVGAAQASGGADLGRSEPARA
jgi:dienelactone hydrolase